MPYVTVQVDDDTTKVITALSNVVDNSAKGTGTVSENQEKEEDEALVFLSLVFYQCTANLVR